MDEVVNTRVLVVNPNDPDPRLIHIAAEELRAGGLVAFPTETVYGLGANAFDAEAVRRIFRVKGRPASDPIIVHLYSLSQLETVAKQIPGLAWQLAQRFWPGPLTLVLKRHENIPAIVSAGRDSVAVRIPAHTVSQALLNAAGIPVAAPSANLFARPSPTTAQHVLEDLRGRIDIVVDGGPATIGIESTVIDATQTSPIVLRPGGIPIETLQTVAPSLIFAPRHLKVDDADTAPASPGMLSKHYSPTAELLLFVGPLADVIARMQETAHKLAAKHKQVGILAPTEEHIHFAAVPAQLVSLGSGSDLAQIGYHLFAGIRELDRQGVDVILIRGFEQKGLGVAIWDRLFRATEGRVIDVTEDKPQVNI